jgi:DNA-binding transcriptional MerR regulator
MRVGDLAARSGVSVRALRYYEEKGLLVPGRSPAGHRRYSEDAVDQVQLIQQLYGAGLSSKAILELMPCVIDGKATPALLERLAAEEARIAQRIDDLDLARSRLISVMSAARANLESDMDCRAPAQF